MGRALKILKSIAEENIVAKKNNAILAEEDMQFPLFEIGDSSTFVNDVKYTWVTSESSLTLDDIQIGWSKGISISGSTTANTSSVTQVILSDTFGNLVGIGNLKG